jgi:hypothetical protein
MNDAVFWGAIVSVAGAVVVLVFLVYKVLQLMNQDAERHQD